MQINSTQMNQLMTDTFVVLVADATGRYATVYGTAPTLHKFFDQLEDLGCEIIEDQTEDYEGYWEEDMIEDGLIPIDRLITDTDFVAHP